MSYEVKKNDKSQRFEIWADGELNGFVTFRHADGTYTLPHTEIFDQFSGHGVGSKLITGVLEQIRDEGADVLPYCPFVPKVIRDNAEFVALVPEAERARFGLDRTGT